MSPTREIERNSSPHLEAGVNKVYVRLDSELVPTGQRATNARLLAPFENIHYIVYMYTMWYPNNEHEIAEFKYIQVSLLKSSLKIFMYGKKELKILKII